MLLIHRRTSSVVGFEAVLSELLLSGNHAQVRNKVTWTSECTLCTNETLRCVCVC